MTNVTLRIVELRCDGPDCFDAFEGHPGQTVREVRTNARAIGWATYSPGGHDYCPDHAPGDES